MKKRTVRGLKTQLMWINLAEHEVRYIRARKAIYTETEFRKYDLAWANYALRNIDRGLKNYEKTGWR